jgi:hypothetical protein
MFALAKGLATTAQRVGFGRSGVIDLACQKRRM